MSDFTPDVYADGSQKSQTKEICCNCPDDGRKIGKTGCDYPQIGPAA